MVRVVRLERTVSWSQTRRDTNFAIPGYSISAIIPRRRRKSKIFLSVVIYVVKAIFAPFSVIWENPTSEGVARLCGVSPCSIPDTTTALPNLAWDRGFTISDYAVLPTKNMDKCAAGNGNALILSDFQASCKSKMFNSASIPRRDQSWRQRSQEYCQRQQVGAAAGTEPVVD